MSEQTEAMGDLWNAMQSMADALEGLNRSGDMFDNRIATQVDELPYGQLRNALIGTLSMTMSLTTAEARTIVDLALNDSVSMEEAYKFFTGERPTI